jgi:hypothetical protein
VEIFDEVTNPLEMVVVIPYIPLFGCERSGAVRRTTKTITHRKRHVLINNLFIQEPKMERKELC